jgi:uncharacterized protein (DUF2252 family)
MAKATKQSLAGRREERLQRGRRQRSKLSRSALGEFEPVKRKTGALDTLLSATEGRLPNLLPVKYQRMAVSPYAFFRGAVSIMAADLGSHPATDLMVQLCGDAHVQNMGCFATPDGHLVFDINDFDETIAGPWEWDVKRMAASLVLAGLAADHKTAGCSEAVSAFAECYCSTLETLAEQPLLTAARHMIRRLTKTKAVTSAFKQAERAAPADLLKKYTETDRHGHVRFKRVEHVLWRVASADGKNVLDSLPLYQKSLAPERLHLFEFFKHCDVAFKIVGTGSVALRDYVVLMENGKDDPLFLQIKQEVHSAYAPYLKHVHYDHQGQRVVEGQRRIQAVSDLLLGWTSVGDSDYLVRQLNDHKGSVELNTLRGDGLKNLAGVAGELLARGHTRSGDPLEIKGYIGSPEKISKAIVKFALRYADVTNDDFEEFQKAIKAGRVKVAGQTKASVKRP